MRHVTLAEAGPGVAGGTPAPPNDTSAGIGSARIRALERDLRVPAAE